MEFLYLYRPPECLECDDDVCDVELCLEVELDGEVLLAVAGLEPGHPLLRPGAGLVPVDNTGDIVGFVLNNSSDTYNKTVLSQRK